MVLVSTIAANSLTTWLFFDIIMATDESTATVGATVLAKILLAIIIIHTLAVVLLTLLTGVDAILAYHLRAQYTATQGIDVFGDFVAFIASVLVLTLVLQHSSFLCLAFLSSNISTILILSTTQFR